MQHTYTYVCISHINSYSTQKLLPHLCAKRDKVFSQCSTSKNSCFHNDFSKKKLFPLPLVNYLQIDFVFFRINKHLYK